MSILLNYDLDRGVEIITRLLSKLTVNTCNCNLMPRQIFELMVCCFLTAKNIDGHGERWVVTILLR